jgi:SNF2-related domain
MFRLRSSLDGQPTKWPPHSWFEGTLKMSDFHNAPREIYGILDLMVHISVIQSFEEDKYSEIPKWDGMVNSWTGNAVLLHFAKVDRPSRLNWFPYSQLRKTEDGLSVYASTWILRKDFNVTGFRKLLLDRLAAAFRDFADLRGYQKNELIPFLIANPFSAAYVDMGLGKTVSVLTVLQELFTLGKIRRCLIIAPLRVAVQTWPTELREWSHTWWMTYTLIRANETHPGLLEAMREARTDAKFEDLLTGNFMANAAKTAHIEKQKRELAATDTIIHIINREAVKWLVEFWGKNWPYDCVIVDESTSFADHRTERWKALNSVRPKITRLHLLSGIPAPEGIEDYFAQVYLLDRGERFGKGITRFKQAYLLPPYSNPRHKWTARPGADKEIADKIADLCMIMREEDYLDREKAIVIERKIILDPPELKLYKTFEKEMILSLPEVEIEAENGAALGQKLLQMASGAVYDTDRKWHHIHDHKIEEVTQLQEEAQGSPLLVAYWHRSSLARLQKAFPKAVKMDREGKCVPAWNAGKIKMLLIHPRSAGHGLNMQHGPGHTLIWFDNPLPYEDYAQTIKRIDRPGQKKIVRVYHLITQHTVDTKIVPILMGKGSAQEIVKKHIRDLRRKWSEAA